MTISYNYFVSYFCNNIGDDKQGEFYFCPKRKKNIYKCSNCVIENEYVETTIKKEVEKTKNNILIFNYLKMKIRNHCCKNIIG